MEISVNQYINAVTFFCILISALFLVYFLFKYLQLKRFKNELKALSKAEIERFKEVIINENAYTLQSFDLAGVKVNVCVKNIKDFDRVKSTLRHKYYQIL